MSDVSVKNKLTILFWVNIVLLISAIIVVVYHKGLGIDVVDEADLVLERFAIIITLGAIPLSLKLFHSRFKKIEGNSSFLPKVSQLFIVRMLILDFVVILNLVGFYIIGASNFMYMSVVPIFVFAMCYPTQALMNPLVVENIIENDNNNLEL